MFVDLENELLQTHSQLLVSLIWKSLHLCAAENIRKACSRFTIYMLEKYVKHKESIPVDLLDIKF